MKKYYLANSAKENTYTSVKVGLNLTEEKYVQIKNWFGFAGFFHTCRSMKNMTIESAKDLETYIIFLRNKNGRHSDLEINNFLISGNKLLISFLSFMKIFVDVLSHAISKEDVQKLKNFKDFNSKLYDDLFGYRFFTRMRNYVVHYDMPLTSITDSVSSGITMKCDRDSLLEYNGWSSVKKEIMQLPETIDILPYIMDAKSAIYALYLKSLETIVDKVVEANQKLATLCGDNNISSPLLIIITDEDYNHPEIEMLPIYLMYEFINDLNEHPNYNIEINTDNNMGNSESIRNKKS